MACRSEGENFYFVQTDCIFGVVLEALTELGKEERLQTLHSQEASIEGIESNDDQNQWKFGGCTLPGPLAFGRTASSVARMCMLRAVNGPSSWWPKIGANGLRRNKDKMAFNSSYSAPGQPQVFTFTNSKDEAAELWSKYDQLYPHYIIQGKVSDHTGRQVSIPKMMLVIRNHFSEVVELNTTLNVTPRGDKEFDSYVHVVCVVRKILPGPDKPNTRQLKKFMWPSAVDEAPLDVSCLSDDFSAKVKLSERDEDSEEEENDYNCCVS